MALIALGLSHSALRESREALAVNQEAVAILGESARAIPASRADHATALKNLGKAYGELGQHQCALPHLLEEALRIVQPLAAENPTLRGDLVRTQVNLSNTLAELQRLQGLKN